ncbi:MAG: hypothetical protein Q8M92_09330 [Candidatus Subteraquimicrobiales bacterium]|nr:hypothetical protein [Candidatus Subteraquimicrobiales bacterium]
MIKKGMTLKKLNSLLKKWQKKLLLDGWKLSLEIVDFKRKDYRQSGDIKVNIKKKTAVILLTKNPFRDEEEVLVHELMHLTCWDLDIFCEKIILKTNKPLHGQHDKYMDKLEKIIEQLTQIVINK